MTVWHRVTHHVRRIHCLQYTSQRIDVADTGVQVLSGLSPNGMVGLVRKDIEEMMSTFILSNAIENHRDSSVIVEVIKILSPRGRLTSDVAECR